MVCFYCWISLRLVLVFVFPSCSGYFSAATVLCPVVTKTISSIGTSVLSTQSSTQIVLTESHTSFDTKGTVLLIHHAVLEQ